MAMIKVHVRNHEAPTWPKDSCRFGKLLVLKISEIFKYPLCDDKVEPTIIEANRTLKYVEFLQVRRGIRDGNVDPVVVDSLVEEPRESRWAAADVEECALPTAGQAVDNSNYLL